MEISSVKLCHGEAVEIITENFLASIVEETIYDAAVARESEWEIRCRVNIINSKRVG
jgi:hypothetical protein